MTGSDLYQRAMAYYDANDSDPALQHQVWDGYPWMLDVHTDGVATDRDRAICDWCRKTFGDEGHPIHGIPGAWHRGGATVFGWTWFGFASADHMRQFRAVWGGTDQEHDGTPPTNTNGWAQ